MGRKVAILWHASFSIGAGVLYFYFVLPRWPELLGEVSHSVGTTLRIVTGALIGLAALPVVFTLLRTRKPELATPQLALTLRTCSIVAHVLAGVLIIGTAISEIWFNLDTAGQWLFAIYGAAAAIAVLGFVAFALSFVAELPPPPPKPIKPKKVKERRRPGKGRGGKAGRKRGKAEEAEDEDEDEDEEDDDLDEADEADDAEADDAEAEETEEAEADDEAAEASAETAEAAVPPVTDDTSDTTEDKTEDKTEEAPGQPRLRNRRPTGKTSHRRRRTRGGVAVDE